MALRVTAGSARGRRLATVPGDAVRPTADRVREAVFNSLASRRAVAGARVLDLYAGTGALGIEALSRGASEAVFVEADRSVAAVLRSNLESVGFAQRAAVIVADAVAALEGLRRRGRRFDVALIDPPYAFEDWPDLMSRLPARLAVAESDRPVDVGACFAVYHRRRHGGTVVTFASAAHGGPSLSGAQH